MTYKQEFINRINRKSYDRLNETIEDYKIQLDLLEKFLEEGTAKTFFKGEKLSGSPNYGKIDNWIKENQSKLNGSSSGNENNSNEQPDNNTSDKQTKENRNKLRKIPGWAGLGGEVRQEFLTRIENREDYKTVKAAVKKAIQEKEGNSSNTSSNNSDSDSSTDQSTTFNSPNSNSKNATGTFPFTPLAGISYQQLLSGYKKNASDKPTETEFNELANYSYFGMVLRNSPAVRDQILENFRTQVGNLNYETLLDDWLNRKNSAGVNWKLDELKKDFLSEEVNIIEVGVEDVIANETDEKEKMKLSKQLYRGLKMIRRENLNEYLKMELFFKDVVEKYSGLGSKIKDAESEEFDNKNWEERDDYEKLYLLFRNKDYKEMAKPENLEKLAELMGDSPNQNSSKPTSTSKPTSKGNDNSTPDFSQAKEKVKKEKEAEQQKEAEAVRNATNDLKNENLPEAERFAKLEEVEEKEGKKSYQENQADIQNSKKDLFTKNASEYRKTMAKVFRKKLTDNGLTEAELTKAVEEWENNQSNDWEEAKNEEKNVNQKIGSSVVKKRVNEIENRIKSCLKSGSKEEMINTLKDLLGLINEAQNNIYLVEYKNKLEQQAKSLEGAISSGGNKEEQTDNKGFFQPKVLIPVGLGATFLGILAVMAIRSRQRKKATK